GYDFSISCFKDVFVLKATDFFLLQLDRNFPELFIEIGHRHRLREIIITQFIGVTANQKAFPKLSMEPQIKLNFHAGEIIVGYLAETVVFSKHISGAKIKKRLIECI